MYSAHVLLIEDDKHFCREVVDYLEQRKFTVDSVVLGEEGINYCMHSSPDIVLCSMNLPDMDGLSVLEQITPSQPSLPVVMIASDTRMSSVVAALRMGAYDFIGKPIPDLSVLLNSISAALNRQHLPTDLDDVEAAISELNYNRQTLKQDLAAAALFQASMLPDEQLSIGRFDIHSKLSIGSEPNRYFIDIISLDERYCGIAIADFGIHHADVALCSGSIKVLLNEALREHKQQHNRLLMHPAAVLCWAEYYLKSLHLTHDVHMFYGVLDSQTTMFRWASDSSKLIPMLYSGGQPYYAEPPDSPDMRNQHMATRTFELRLDPRRPLFLSSLNGAAIHSLGHNQPASVASLVAQLTEHHCDASDVMVVAVGGQIKKGCQ